ncbi:hypothetical protein ACFOG5_11310 [Pedobacter fastidiosus]
MRGTTQSYYNEFYSDRIKIASCLAMTTALHCIKFKMTAIPW